MFAVSADRQRIRFIPVESAEEAPLCWNCGKAVAGPAEATFIYPRQRQVLVDRWLRCECGAYQNTSRRHEITIEGYKRANPPG